MGLGEDTLGTENNTKMSRISPFGLREETQRKDSLSALGRDKQKEEKYNRPGRGNPNALVRFSIIPVLTRQYQRG